MSTTREMLAAIGKAAAVGMPPADIDLKTVSRRMETRSPFRDAVLATLLFDVSLDFACAMTADPEDTSGELGDIMTRAWNEGVPSVVVERLNGTRCLLDAIDAATVSDSQPLAVHAYILWWMGLGEEALPLAVAALERDRDNTLARLVRASVAGETFPDYLKREE